MAIEILMPALSPTMESGTLAKWLVKEGDEVSSGDIIAEIETDKATMEVDTPDEGRIARIVVAEGTEDVPVNQVIALLAEDGEDVSAVDVSAPAPAPAVEATQPVAAPAVVSAPAPTVAVAHEPEVAPGTAMVELTVREALRDAMAEEMRSTPEVFVMGEEVAEYQGAYKVTQGLLDEFGAKRVIDTPITEHGFAGLAVGAAFGGLKPIVEFMTFNFSMQAIDHIINSAAKTLYMSGGQMGCPIVFRGPNGPASRVGAQHSQDYASWYAHIPGLKVVAPYSASDAKGLLKAAIRDPNPVVFLENEILYGKKFEVPDVSDHIVPIGKAKVVRPGTDVTIVAYSRSVDYAEQAAQLLSEQGIDAEIVDLRTLRPLDIETVIASVQKTNRVVTVEETWQICGIGSEISAQLMEHAFDYLDAPVLRISQKDVPMPYAANLEQMALPQVSEIVEAARQVCYK